MVLISDYSWLFRPSLTSTRSAPKPRGFHPSGAGLWLIEADSSAREHQLTHILNIKCHTSSPQHSLFFPLKSHKPGFHRPHFPQRYFLPSSHKNSSWSLEHSTAFMVQSSKCFYNPPTEYVEDMKDHVVRYIIEMPHCSNISFSSLLWENTGHKQLRERKAFLTL